MLRLPLILLPLLGGCMDSAWNNPYPAAESGQNVYYSTFEERPKYLDPARSYSSNEWQFISQIYEPPLQYHFLRRPYELIPLVAAEMPRVQAYDATGRALGKGAPTEQIAHTDYEIRIQPGIRYQPHPAFARNEDGSLAYWPLALGSLEKINILRDFPLTGSRELVAEDFVYQVKRLAFGPNHSPISGLMQEYILGYGEFAGQAAQAYEKLKQDTGEEDPWLDLRQIPMQGVTVLDRYTYRIRLKGTYPQFIYWLSMNFFAPIPWEAERFYKQPGMSERNITLHWYPVGTGPYMLTENNPNLRMVLARNPNFRGESYPLDGEPGDEAAGLLADAGKTMPFIDRAVYSLEKEDIPRWNKFLQGYYDSSGIGSDSFDQAVQFGTGGDPQLTDAMVEQGIQLNTAVTTSIFYTGFNMKDPVVGGNSKRARLLRRAIAIAVDMEEYISIFNNGRGLAANGPLPPGIFGYREGEAGINPYVYQWVNGRAKRRSIDEAKQLLAEAGYRNGRDPDTGKPLILNYDTMAAGPESKAVLDWYRHQFSKLGIQLVIRSTDYNRFQSKILKGDAQIYTWGWNADYSDPENFLFLLYGPNGKVEHHGENASNYSNAEFDVLYKRMKNLPNGTKRQAAIDRMVEILRRDGPWIWGVFPKAFGLHHSWYHNTKPNLMANNALKYRRIDPGLRAEKRAAWNQPVVWPVILLLVLLVVSAIPAWIGYRRREQGVAR